MVTCSLPLKNLTDLRVISAGAVRPVVSGLADRFEEENDALVWTRWGTVGETMKRLVTESADVVIASAEAIAKAIKDGLVVPDSCVDLAKVGMGACVPLDAQMPDISSVKAFVQAIFAASPFVYTDPASGGTGGNHMKGLLPRLGITGMQIRTVLCPNGVGTCEKVALLGEGAFGVSMISEIMSVPRVTLVGPLPPQLQKVTTYSAGITTKAATPDIARAFVAFLVRPEFMRKYDAAGLDYKE